MKEWIGSMIYLMSPVPDWAQIIFDRRSSFLFSADGYTQVWIR